MNELFVKVSVIALFVGSACAMMISLFVWTAIVNSDPLFDSLTFQRDSNCSLFENYGNECVVQLFESLAIEKVVQFSETFQYDLNSPLFETSQYYSSFQFCVIFQYDLNSPLFERTGVALFEIFQIDLRFPLFESSVSSCAEPLFESPTIERAVPLFDKTGRLLSSLASATTGTALPVSAPLLVFAASAI